MLICAWVARSTCTFRKLVQILPSFGSCAMPANVAACCMLSKLPTHIHTHIIAYFNIFLKQHRSCAKSSRREGCVEERNLGGKIIIYYFCHALPGWNEGMEGCFDRAKAYCSSQRWSVQDLRIAPLYQWNRRRSRSAANDLRFASFATYVFCINFCFGLINVHCTKQQQ